MKKVAFYLFGFIVLIGGAIVFVRYISKKNETIIMALEIPEKVTYRIEDCDNSGMGVFLDVTFNAGGRKLLRLVSKRNTEGLPVPDKNDFVNVTEYIPGIYVDLKYSTTDNFTGKRIYDFSEAYLRYGTVEKLSKVYKAVSAGGYSLKIWDAFRPTDSQYVLWNVYPDSRYVANPNTGFSKHSRGNTVDITLVNTDGTELEMPSGFDDFSARADRDYSDCTQMAGQNATYLEQAMIQNGFKAYSGEWWHFFDSDIYPVENEFRPERDIDGTEEN